jgi:deferrochelatase/peroxidase EfeB
VIESNDADGNIVPRAAHIRKTYPRDEDTPGGVADTQTHRVLRRGIPFGISFQDNAPSGSPAAGDAKFPNDRGLLFLAYQRSIANQFEFIQQLWVNNADFPQGGDGHDPLISEAEDKRNFSLPGGKNASITGISQWVTTTGGAYFFQPSIDALKKLVGA